MFQGIKQRLGTAGFVVAVIAVVLAMVGGAFAASNALNGKQKKEVEKIAKKYAGKPGSPGEKGAKGDKGDPGQNGSNGTSGSNGKNVALVSTTPAGCVDGGVEYAVEGSGDPHEICNGEAGEGQDAGFNYVFSSSTTETDPGSGKLNLNNAALGSATTLSISENDLDGNELASVIEGWLTGASAQGTVLIRKEGDPTTFAEYSISRNVQAENSLTEEPEPFYKISVTPVATKGTLANGDPVTIAYWSSGTQTLPEGATETGTWRIESSGAETVSTIINFPVPLFFRTENVHVVPRPSTSTDCPTLNPELPTIDSAAPPRTLCVYLQTPIGGSEYITSGEIKRLTNLFVGASPTGALLKFETHEAGEAVGSWIVSGG